MARPPPGRAPREFPEHLLRQVIMPRLPFKSLSRWKCLSKEIHSLITADTQFSDEQAVAATSSSSFVYISPGGLSFFPDQASAGVPEPSLQFLNPSSMVMVTILSSTNGLLLLRGIFNGNKSICVCNPATKETVFVPDVDKNKYYWCICHMGLAYDPCKSPNRYIIVHPVIFTELAWRGCAIDVFYSFDVLCSNTGKWTRSRQRVQVPNRMSGSRAECAGGVIYWSCGDHLLWYDTDKDLAGVRTLPMIEGKVIKGHMKIGVYDGKITCCRAWEGGVEVWILSHDNGKWDRLHAGSWERMVEAVESCHHHGMHLRRASPGSRFFKRRVVRAVGFDGQFVYITVRMRRDDKLFAWETKTGCIEEKGLITLTPTNRYHFDVFCSYANSMARLPLPLPPLDTLRSMSN